MFGIRKKIERIRYRKRNKHNFTTIKECIGDLSTINVGNGTYGTINIKRFAGENSKLYIGNYCSIANETLFVLGGEHVYDRISTYPFKDKYLNEGESKTKGDIIIEDDVWIGYGSTILSGVRIGQGSIVGARSVVAKDIPPYAIYAGNKIIKYRFSEQIIKRLLKVDFGKLSKEKIINNMEYLYKKIDNEDIDEIINKVNG